LDDFQVLPICLSGKINVWMEMSMEHWWKTIDRGKPKYWEKNLSQWHLARHFFTFWRLK